MNLQDGTKKMSKSDPSDKTRINLTDDADTIAKRRIRKAKTDPDPLPDALDGLESRPEARNPVNTLRGPCRCRAASGARRACGRAFSGISKWRWRLWPSTAGPDLDRDDPPPLMADPAEIDRILGRGAEAGRPRDHGDRSSSGPTISWGCCEAEKDPARVRAGSLRSFVRTIESCEFSYEKFAPLTAAVRHLSS